MTLAWPRPIALSALLLFAAGSSAQALEPSAHPFPANDPILKMLAADLPEDVIVGKIRQGAGTWNTSVDALVALKASGATKAELNAMVATDGMKTAPTQRPAAPIAFMGGKIAPANDGRIVMKFPDSEHLGTYNSPDILGLSLDLGTLNGKVALKLSNALIWDRRAGGFKCSNTRGDLYLTADGVIFNPYDRELCSSNKKPQPLGVEVSDTLISADHLSVSHWSKHGGYEGSTSFDKAKSLYFDIGGGANGPTLESRVFLDEWQNEPSRFMTGLAAALGDMVNALPEFRLISVSERAAKVDADWDARQRMKRLRPNVDGGSTLAVMGAVLAGIGGAAQQESTAVAHGDTAGQMQANARALQITNETMNGASPSQPVTSSTPAGSAPREQAPSSSNAAHSYDGPQAQWVRRLVASAPGQYSCSPFRLPPIPTAMNCAMRDGSIYKARSIAIAIECSQQTGQTAQIPQYVKAMMEELQTAGQSCAAATNAPQCSTASLISCADLPR